MNIEIQGLAGLIKKLDYLGENSSDLIDKGLHKGALKIQTDAKKAAPRDTGMLQDKGIIVEKIPRGYAVGSFLKYAPYVEFGTGTLGDPTVPHTAKTSWRFKYRDKNGVWHWCTCHGMKPRAFLHPAFNKNKNYVIKSVREEMRAAIEKKLGG